MSLSLLCEWVAHPTNRGTTVYMAEYEGMKLFVGKCACCDKVNAGVFIGPGGLRGVTLGQLNSETEAKEFLAENIIRIKQLYSKVGIDADVVLIDRPGDAENAGS